MASLERATDAPVFLTHPPAEDSGWKRVLELEAENRELKEMLSNKFVLKFEVKDGYTILDFMRVWHIQERDRADRAEAKLAIIREAIKGVVNV